MQLIRNLEQLNDIIQNYLRKDTFTNNYLLSNSYSEYIAHNKLYYLKKAHNAVILAEKHDFLQLYYYISNLDELMDVSKIDIPITMEILYRGELQRPCEIISYWEKCGFRQHLTRDMMTASFKQLTLPPENEPNIQTKYAETNEEITFSKELMDATFDKYTGDILTYNEIILLAKKKNIICAYLEKNLCGILQFEIRNNVFWLGHIAVDTKFRGFGVANSLVKTFITINMKLPETRYHLWVIKNNTKATTLYKKFGFIYGNKTSASMLKE